jgi:tRNA(Ile)-lysidine synthase TilS/MesJ
VGISGGKDSSFALMELKRSLGLRVEAFTYIHEGSTPFAYENAQQLCKRLDVKHHVISLPGKAHLNSFKDFLLPGRATPQTLRLPCPVSPVNICTS